MNNEDFDRDEVSKYITARYITPIVDSLRAFDLSDQQIAGYDRYLHEMLDMTMDACSGLVHYSSVFP